MSKILKSIITIITSILTLVALTGCAEAQAVSHVTERGLKEFLSLVESGDYQTAEERYVADVAKEQYRANVVDRNLSDVEILYYEDMGDSIVYTVEAEIDDAYGRERVEYELRFQPGGIGGVSGWKVVNIEYFYG